MDAKWKSKFSKGAEATFKGALEFPVCNYFFYYSITQYE